MSHADVSWPSVGQISVEVEQHRNLLQQEAQDLLEFGAPSSGNEFGKQCPYETVAALCTSLLVYLESTASGNNAPSKSILVNAQSQLPSAAGQPSKGKESTSSLVAPRSSTEPTVTSHIQRMASSTVSQLEPFREHAPAPIDTFGILVLCVPSSFDVDNQAEAIRHVVSRNRGFIPKLTVKSVQWLIPEWAKTKNHSSLLVEITRPEDANAAIREDLVFGHKVLKCEHYERDSRLRQCLRCQQYGHLEQQCQAQKYACGRCAGAHPTIKCSVSDEDPDSLCCAVCNDAHRAWDSVCSARKLELDRVRQARVSAPKYHPVDGTVPEYDSMHLTDVPSREFAGTRKYSIAYLVELNVRTNANIRRLNGAESTRKSSMPDATLGESEAMQPRTPRTVKHDMDTIHEDVSAPHTAGNLSGIIRFHNEKSFKADLKRMGIEVHSTPAEERTKIEELEATPTPDRRKGREPQSAEAGTPRRDAIPMSTPRKQSGILNTPRRDMDSSSKRDRFAAVSGTHGRVSSLPERLISNSRNEANADRSPSEKAATFKKLREEKSWR